MFKPFENVFLQMVDNPAHSNPALSTGGRTGNPAVYHPSNAQNRQPVSGRNQQSASYGRNGENVSGHNQQPVSYRQNGEPVSGRSAEPVSYGRNRQPVSGGNRDLVSHSANTGQNKEFGNHRNVDDVWKSEQVSGWNGGRVEIMQIEHFKNN